VAIHEKLRKKIKTRENLQKLVEKYPKSQLASMFEVSPPTITKLCNEWDVKCPSQGYWNKFR
jgi:hypothetical protein